MEQKAENASWSGKDKKNSLIPQKPMEADLQAKYKVSSLQQ